jgi:AraC-like DNA-binding protein
MRRNSAVFMWRDRALFLGDRSTTAVHSHYACEISVALDDGGLTTAVADGPTLSGVPGAVVASATPHSLDIPGEKVAVLYLDPAGHDGVSVQAWLDRRPCAALSDGAARAVRPSLLELFERRTGLEDASRACAALVESLTTGSRRSPARGRLDPRVEQVVALLEARLDQPPSLAEAAAAVSLSPTRLRQLFSEQVGVPMRSYLLWLRLRAALTAALGGLSMTEAAHRAGFADSAHFTRTCQSMFGLPPTAFAPVDEVFLAE